MWVLCSVVAIDLGLGGQYRWSETLWESRGWSGWLPPLFSVGGSNSGAVDTCSALQTVTISSWSWWSWWSQWYRWSWSPDWSGGWQCHDRAEQCKGPRYLRHFHQGRGGGVPNALSIKIPRKMEAQTSSEKLMARFRIIFATVLGPHGLVPPTKSRLQRLIAQAAQGAHATFYNWIMPSLLKITLL